MTSSIAVLSGIPSTAPPAARCWQPCSATHKEMIRTANRKVDRFIASCRRSFALPLAPFAAICGSLHEAPTYGGSTCRAGYRLQELGDHENQRRAVALRLIEQHAHARSIRSPPTMGLEAVVARELADLGYPSRIVEVGRIAFQADERAICRTNLWLRTAGRVLIQAGSFPAADFGELFDRTYALPWDRWIAPNAAFPVAGRSLKSQLSSVPACQRIVKKAVAEKLIAAHGAARLEETGPPCQIEVSVLKDVATLTLDTSGSGLHKRGYRPLVGKAPLRETLAAGLVLLSFWKPDRPLVDPFCGTGTIPIEAALIGRNLAPGLNRSFAAEAWPTLAASLWQAAREEARDLARPSLPERILGTDLDGEALDLARHHAVRAGVAADIHFQQRDFLELSSKRTYGCVITNPPYAERMGSSAEVAGLYRAIPEVLRRLKTWSHFILTAYPDFEAAGGAEGRPRHQALQQPDRVHVLPVPGPRPPRADSPMPADDAELAEPGEEGDVPTGRRRRRNRNVADRQSRRSAA